MAVLLRSSKGTCGLLRALIQGALAGMERVMVEDLVSCFYYSGFKWIQYFILDTELLCGFEPSVLGVLVLFRG